MKTRAFTICCGLAVLLLVRAPALGQYYAPYGAGGPSPYAYSQAAYYGAPAGYGYGAPQGVVPALAYQPPAPMPAGEMITDAEGSCATCETCGEPTCGGCGCVGGWTHHVAVYGEYLYLRPRDAEVTYAVEMNGPIAPPPAVPIQVAPEAVVDPGYTSGFRGGFAVSCGTCSSISATYSRFESDESDWVGLSSLVPNTVIRSMVQHPSVYNVAYDDLEATANSGLKFDLIDVDFRRLLATDCTYEVAYLVGARYGQLEQQFNTTFGVNGTRTVVTDIDFDGIGVRLGLEGEVHTRSRRWMGYARGVANYLAGEYRGTFEQGQVFDASEVDTAWQADRITSIYELEVGGGWTSRCGTCRVLAGYMFNVWGNVVKTDEFIQAVQRNNFNNLGDTLTFDGLVLRVEGRF